MPVLGLVGNMSGLVCPHCGKEVPVFGSGGGRRTAERMNVHFLGSLPFDLGVVEAGDAGATLQLAHDASRSFSQALSALADHVIERCSPLVTRETEETQTDKIDRRPTVEANVLRIAVPTADGVLCNHFGHLEKFVLLDVHGSEIQSHTEVTPPPHEPGLLPRWLADQGVGVVIAGGMGHRAVSLFEERGIRVLTGAPPEAPQNLVRRYLDGTLECGKNVCDH